MSRNLSSYQRRPCHILLQFRVGAGAGMRRDCTYSQSARFRLSTECLALIEELSGFPNRRRAEQLLPIQSEGDRPAYSE